MWEQYTVTLQRVSPSAPPPKHTRPHVIRTVFSFFATESGLLHPALQQGKRDLNDWTCCHQLLAKKAQRAQITDVTHSLPPQRPLSESRSGLIFTAENILFVLRGCESFRLSGKGWNIEKDKKYRQNKGGGGCRSCSTRVRLGRTS